MFHRPQNWKDSLEWHESDYMKDNFCKESVCVFDQFLKYDMKILVWDFNAKEGREDIFKPTIWNESMLEIINDNGFRVINFAI